MQELNLNEIAEISGGAITLGGPGFEVSIDPFVAADSLLGNTLGLVSGTVDAVVGIVGL